MLTYIWTCLIGFYFMLVFKALAASAYDYSSAVLPPAPSRLENGPPEQGGEASAQSLMGSSRAAYLLMRLVSRRELPRLCIRDFLSARLHQMLKCAFAVISVVFKHRPWVLWPLIAVITLAQTVLAVRRPMFLVPRLSWMQLTMRLVNLLMIVIVLGVLAADQPGSAATVPVALTLYSAALVLAVLSGEWRYGQTFLWSFMMGVDGDERAEGIRAGNNNNDNGASSSSTEPSTSEKLENNAPSVRVSAAAVRRGVKQVTVDDLFPLKPEARRSKQEIREAALKAMTDDSTVIVADSRTELFRLIEGLPTAAVLVIPNRALFEIRKQHYWCAYFHSLSQTHAKMGFYEIVTPPHGIFGDLIPVSATHDWQLAVAIGFNRAASDRKLERKITARSNEALVAAGSTRAVDSGLWSGDVGVSALELPSLGASSPRSSRHPGLASLALERDEKVRVMDQIANENDEVL